MTERKYDKSRQRERERVNGLTAVLCVSNEIFRQTLVYIEVYIYIYIASAL